MRTLIPIFHERKISNQSRGLAAVVVRGGRARVFSKIVTKAKTLSKKKMLSLQIHGYQGNINKLGNLQIMISLMSNAK